MKTPLLAVSMIVLLCACSKQTPAGSAPAPVASDATAAARAASDSAASSTDAPPPPTAEAATAPVPATGDAGDQAVNDAIDSNLGDHVRYQAVIRQFQTAVAAGDAAKVAALVNYPIGVDIGGKNVVLKDDSQFVARYPEFMTDDIRKAIVETKYSDLFVNYKGVMFGSGQAWINGICKDDQCKAFEVKVVKLQHGP